MVTKTTYLVRLALMAMGALALASLFSADMALAGAGGRNDRDASKSSNPAPAYFKDCDGCPEMVTVPAGRLAGNTGCHGFAADGTQHRE